MSLINKMLQDLDARGGQPGPAAVSPEIKPVPSPERGFPWLRVALLGGLVVVLGASGYLAWRMERGVQDGQPAAEVPVDIGGAQVQAQAVTPAPAPAATTAQVPSAPVPALSEAPAPEPAPAQVRDAAPPLPAVQGAPRPESATTARPIPRGQPPKAEAPARQAARPPAATDRAPVRPGAAQAPAGRSETVAQRAENGYRRALASLEDGRVTEAIGHLHEALRANPRHEAARQTLVGLLIEAKRPEEAMRQLGAALALDPAQPAMAMLMARLQLERGSPGIDTLMRTLPHATANADYRAFLAGALQREERHREAVDHYLAALRLSPQNGVWWMGLGISLQAEKRQQEAAAAFQKALDSGNLSAELQGFVERKLKQFGR